MKITRKNLRFLVEQALGDYDSDEDLMYTVGREDAIAGLRPLNDDENYMMGYNDAMADLGLDPLPAPEPGSSKPLDPGVLKTVFLGKKR